MAYTIPHFMGYRFGLFNYATQSTGGYADFDFYRVGSSVNNIIYNGPNISITNPVSGNLHLADEDITLTASANSPNGTITSVQFFNGNTLLGSDNSSPYSFTWSKVPAGTYNVRAVATDNQGKTSETGITIKVNVPRGPYNDAMHQIPGIIQLEHFDVGGNGFAYMDGTPGSEVTPSVNFRPDEDVDIESCTDTGGGYNIGWTNAGEWLEYTVDVTKPGTYDLALRIACNGDGRTVSVTMDDKDIGTDIIIPNTAGWQNWQTVTMKDIKLTAGQKVMRVTIGATDFVNLNYVNFTLTKELKQEPYNETAHRVPGRIEAEEYDLGGEGLAYHEANNNGNQGGAILRNDEVDIEVTLDTDGEYNLGYTLKGEWLEYTVDVISTGAYVLQLRVASDGDGKQMHVEIDGVNVTGAINVPNTGGWQTWETITINDVSIKEGHHVMRLVFDSDYMNLNFIQFNDVITGVSVADYSDIKFFPNPFHNDGLHVRSEGEFTYRIIDVNGLEIESGRVSDEHSIGLSLKPGVYMISFKNKEGDFISKIVKL
jgi:hypothetical protein